eukprot:SM000255S08765  [mRNA]  locus=s255:27806:28819:+ [translate_table: standard]
MGGKRRSAYHDDLWNIKYLQKFKWDELTEEIGLGTLAAYRNAVREQKLAAEVSAAKRERDFYLARVDQSRAITAMAERKRKRFGEGLQKVSGATGDDAVEAAVSKPRVIRRFHQRAALAADAGERRGGGSGMEPTLASDVLASVFGENSQLHSKKQRLPES